MALSIHLPSLLFILDGWVKVNSIKLKTVEKFLNSEFNRHTIMLPLLSVKHVRKERLFGEC